MASKLDQIKNADAKRDLTKLSELLEVNDLVVIGWSLDAMVDRFLEARDNALKLGDTKIAQKNGRIIDRLMAIRSAVMNML